VIYFASFQHRVPVSKAIAGNKHTEWRRIVGRLREAAVRTSLLYARTAATKKAGEKTSQAICLLTEIAQLARGLKTMWSYPELACD
jgi:hypothetical protein